MFKYLFQNQHFCIPFFIFFHRFPLPLPGWWLCIALWHWSNRSHLCQHPFLVLPNNASINRAIAACFDVFDLDEIAVKEPRAFTSSVVSTKPSTCRQDTSNEQGKTSKLLTETDRSRNHFKNPKNPEPLTLGTPNLGKLNQLWQLWNVVVWRNSKLAQSVLISPNQVTLVCSSPFWMVRLAVSEKYNYANMLNLPVRGTQQSNISSLIFDPQNWTIWHIYI